MGMKTVIGLVSDPRKLSDKMPFGKAERVWNGIKNQSKKPKVGLLVFIVIAAALDAYFGKSLLWKFLVGIVSATGLVTMASLGHINWKKGEESGMGGGEYVFGRILDLAAGFASRFTNVPVFDLYPKDEERFSDSNLTDEER